MNAKFSKPKYCNIERQWYILKQKEKQQNKKKFAVLINEFWSRSQNRLICSWLNSYEQKNINNLLQISDIKTLTESPIALFWRERERCFPLEVFDVSNLCSYRPMTSWF